MADLSSILAPEAEAELLAAFVAACRSVVGRDAPTRDGDPA